ncbi:MAG: hypothetical protein ABI771_00485 [Betaproteobacteria bacterium]
MIIVRLLGSLLLIAVGDSAAVYLITRDKRWLRFGWQLLKFGVLILLIIVALFALERIAVAI